MKKTNLGGQRLGSGNKNDVTLNSVGSSNHDLSYIWRNTQAVGTLVPFMNIVALPGDKFDIELNADVKTSPTVGPLFGSLKLQLDLFTVPFRLYNAKLHNNPLDVGLNMSNIKLPLVEMNVQNQRIKADMYDDLSTFQINPSSLISYLGMRSYGHNKTLDTFKRRWNAVPLIAYFDIFKNYYANKMEDYAYCIINRDDNVQGRLQMVQIGLFVKTVPQWEYEIHFNDLVQFSVNDEIHILGDDINIEKLYFGCSFGAGADPVIREDVKLSDKKYFELIDVINAIHGGKLYKFKFISERIVFAKYLKTKIAYNNTEVKLRSFPLKNIDTLRTKILQHSGNSPFIIKGGDRDFQPINDILNSFELGDKNTDVWMGSQFPQHGLLIKTYQSDIFNNWLKEEFVTGVGSIEDLTKIDTSEGYFTIDTLNLSTKIYKMLQRILVSGNTYQDWIESVYDIDLKMNTEIPRYIGGMSQEIMFQEIISTADSDAGPLGTLAGRGTNIGNKKGGNIIVEVKEPSIIMGIVSITPRVDYSEGNDWSTALKTLDDLHKPQLDEIGYQNLLTENMAAITTEVAADGTETYKSIGFQPAWIHYMTNFNKACGNFALKNNQQFMTLSRTYNVAKSSDGSIELLDATTYIDPKKYNYIFSETSRDSMNFWVQIDNRIFARRKMSAKVIPNL